MAGDGMHSLISARAIAAAALLQLLPAVAGAACTDGRQPTVEQEAKSAKAVVEARVVAEQAASEDPDDPSGISAYVYTLRTTRQFLGRMTRTFSVRSENTSARFPMTTGRRYLLFLHPAANGSHTIDNCGNSAAIEAGAAAIARLPRRHR